VSRENKFEGTVRLGKHRLRFGLSLAPLLEGAGIEPAPPAVGVEREPQVELQQQVADSQTLIEQLEDALKQGGVAPVPPPRLQRRVVGGFFRDFIRSGTVTIAEFDDALGPLGVSCAMFEHVLDFGVGCGRVLRRWAETHKSAKITGIDIDPEAVGWLKEHYSRFGRFLVTPPNPPAELASDQFDFIYGVSVFTHLPEDMQFLWLQELKRLVKPGGWLILTVRGNEVSEREGFSFVRHDATDGLPDFYRTTYHSKRYVEDVWSRYFEVTRFVPLGLRGGNQDMVVCRRPST
jgi:SAM-dependent methyltransferase